MALLLKWDDPFSMNTSLLLHSHFGLSRKFYAAPYVSSHRLSIEVRELVMVWGRKESFKEGQIQCYSGITQKSQKGG